MLFQFEGRVIDTSKLNTSEEFEWWLVQLKSNIEDMRAQLATDTILLTSGSPSKSKNWRHSINQKMKYFRTVSGQLEHERNEWRRANLPTADKIRTFFMVVASERLGSELFQEMLADAQDRAKEDKFTEKKDEITTS